MKEVREQKEVLGEPRMAVSEARGPALPGPGPWVLLPACAHRPRITCLPSRVPAQVR